MPAIIHKIKISRVHNWTAYVAFGLIILHPVLLLLDKSTKFFLADIAIPFHSDYQTPWTALGIISFYAVVLVIITTQKFVRKRLGFRLWKNVHLVSYATALLMCIHGIVLDPELKNRTPDFLDGEKLLCEICLIVIIATFLARLAYHKKHSKRKNSALIGAK